MDPPVRTTYAHVALAALPAELADLHSSLPVGSPIDLELPAGDGDHAGPRTELLAQIVASAGFSDIGLAERDGATRVTATRVLTLPDYVGPGMRLLICGLNPSIYSAEAGAGFARPGNRFWPAMTAAGLTSRPGDPRRLLRHDRIGMTDLVKRPTRRANEIDADEYRVGVGRVGRLVEWLQPGALCVVGLTGWRKAIDRRAHAGEQTERLGGRPVYVMPNTSGLNAHSKPDDFRAHLVAAAALADT